MAKKDFFNFVVAILLCILTYPLLYIILFAVFGGGDPFIIEYITLLLGSIFGGLFACLFAFIKPLFK